MPKPPLIRSERLRLVVIAISMIALLAGSLAAAQALVLTRGTRPLDAEESLVRTRVGELELVLPAGWARLTPSGRIGPPRAADGFEAFADPRQPQHRIVIHRIDRPSPQSPEQVLDQLVRGAEGDGDVRVVESERIRVGAAAGVRCALVGDAGEDVTLRFVALLTQDGRRYWSLVLHTSLRARPQQGQRLKGLFEQIVRSVRDHSSRPPTPQDFRQAGLSLDGVPPALPPAMTARVPVAASDPPIEVVASQDQVLWHVLRVRGVVDTGISDPDQALSPASLLAGRFRHIVGRPAGPADLKRESLDGVESWRVALAPAPGDGEPGLARELWYLRLGDERGVVVDVLGEPAAVADSPRWVRDLAAALRAPQTAATPAATSLAVDGLTPAMEEALLHGAAVAASMREGLWETVASERWYVLEIAERVTDLQVTLAGTLQGAALPLRGRSLRMRVTDRRKPPELIARWTWAASRDGGTFIEMMREARPADSDEPESLRRLEYAEGRLTLAELRQGRMVPRWSMAAPDAYVPSAAEDAWPLELLSGTDSPPAVVWLTASDEPPLPFWVEAAPGAAPGGDGDAGAATGGVTLRIRPLLGVDVNQLEVDATGRVIAYRWHAEPFSPAGALLVQARTAERSEVLRLFPAVRGMLEAWEAQEPDDELLR